MSAQIRTFRIEIPQSDLDELAHRLAGALLPRQLPGIRDLPGRSKMSRDELARHLGER